MAKYQIDAVGIPYDLRTGQPIDPHALENEIGRKLCPNSLLYTGKDALEHAFDGLEPMQKDG